MFTCWKSCLLLESNVYMLEVMFTCWVKCLHVSCHVYLLIMGSQTVPVLQSLYFYSWSLKSSIRYLISGSSFCIIWNSVEQSIIRYIHFILKCHVSLKLHCSSTEWEGKIDGIRLHQQHTGNASNDMESQEIQQFAHWHFLIPSLSVQFRTYKIRKARSSQSHRVRHQTPCCL